MYNNEAELNILPHD